MTTSADLAHVRDVAAADRPAAARWAWLAARQRTWLAALLIVIFSALVLPPFVLLVQGSLTVGSTGISDGHWGFGNFEAVLRSRHFVETSVNSLVFAAASALLALVVGWVTAWIVERTNTPLKPLAYLTAIISLGTPYILYVSAWQFKGENAAPELHKEPLVYEEVHMSTRSYK